MTQRMKLAEEHLKESRAACVAVKVDSAVHTSDLSGIRPLLQWLEQDPGSLQEACIADRVVGKAAALLMIYGGAEEVYGEILSDAAAACLERHGIPYSCGERVPQILNRDGTDMCPMERRCMEIDSPQQAYEVFRQMIKGR